MKKDLEWMIKNVYKNRNHIDWVTYYPHLEEIFNNTLYAVKENILGTSKFIHQYFFTKDMRIKRKEHTRILFDTLKERGYRKSVAKFVATYTPMPTDNRYAINFLKYTVGLLAGRIPESTLKLIHKNSHIPLPDLKNAIYKMEYINNLFSGGQIAVGMLVLVNGIYSLATGDSLPIEKNFLLGTFAMVLKYVHTINDHNVYLKNGKYRANHIMIFTPGSWYTYLPSMSFELYIKLSNRKNSKKSQSPHKSYKHEGHADRT